MRGGTEVTKDGREKQEVKDPRCYLNDVIPRAPLCPVQGLVVEYPPFFPCDWEGWEQTLYQREMRARDRL